MIDEITWNEVILIVKFFSMGLQDGCFEMCDIFSGNFNKFATD